MNFFKRFFNNGIAQNSLVLAFVQCITMCTGIVQTMILSRVLSKQVYGTYSQGVFIINFCIPFLMLGLSNAITYFSGQDKLDKKKYVNTIFALITALGVVGAVIILCLSQGLVVYFDNPMLKTILIFVAIRPLLQNLITAYQTLYVANGMSMYIAIRNLLISLFQIVIIVIGTVVLGNIVAIFFLLICMDIIQIMFFTLHFRKKQYAIDLREADVSIVKTLFSYAVPLAFSTMISTLSVYMDKLIVGRMMSTEDFALYSNMSKELPFYFVVSSFTTIITPVLVRLSTKNKEKMVQVWKDYLEIGYLTTWILCGGAIVCAPELLEFLYSSKYSEGILVFVIYLLISCVRFTYFGIVLSAYGKTKWIMICTIVTLGANMILNMLLIGPLGMIGPALASLIVISIMGFLQIRLGCKLADCRITDVFNIKQMLVFLTESILIGGAIIIVKLHVEANYVLVLIIAYMVYVASLLLLNKKSIMRVLRSLNNTES